MSAAAGVLNFLGMVLPASALKPSATLVNVFDKIFKTMDLGAAKADLIAGAPGRISATTAAHAIAEHISQLFAGGGVQRGLLKHDLKAASMALTATQVKTLDTAATIVRLSKTLITTAKLDTQLQNGAPVEVNFIASAG